MSVLVTAAENIPPEWNEAGQFAGLYFSVIGYAATLASLRSANQTFEAKLSQAKLQDAVYARIAETARHQEVVAEALEAADAGEKYDVHQHFSRLGNERQRLENQAVELEKNLMSSAIRSRTWADLMLLLTFLGVAGGAALMIMQLFIIAPFVLAVSPGTYVAYRRLNGATKEATGMAHTERMRQLEYDEKKLELQEKRSKIADQQEVRELETAERRIELMGKRHELQEKFYAPEPADDEPEGQR